MFNYGLIGKKLSHSYSKIIHNKLFNTEYDLKELNEEEFSFFMEEKSFKGINVTIPYKQDVMKYLDYIDNDAKVIGAVNTVVNDNGILKGYNTDILGLEYVIKKAKIELNNKKVLILGTGGTSKTAFVLCKQYNANNIYRVSRKNTYDINIITYEEIKEKYNDFNVIINTTPCGMFPKVNEEPIDLSILTNLEAVVDVIYNPLRTLIRINADKKNTVAVNGLYMLVAQAVYANNIFFNNKIDFDIDKIDDIYKYLLKQKLNICLIGMPYSGKSSIGKVLAERLNKKFVDVDDYIIEKYNRTPKDIIENDGEDYFRDIESDVIKTISNMTNTIIATGGGSVLREENVDRLKMNSVVVYIKRLNPIFSNNRPLAKNKTMFDELYQKRKHIYENSCDIIIDNEKDIELCINEIINKYNDLKIIF